MSRIFRLLSQLLDVEIVSPVDNDRLQYEAASGKWKNTSVSGVAPHHVSHEEGGTDEVSVTVGMIDAEASTDGQVPTSDGAGGVTWEDQSGSGGGAPTDVDYLVGTASGDLSAEIVVGTSPGGELGGTWASPTVDTTHSGSSHASVQAAAEATAASALSTHASDTTSVHGISDTSALLDTGDVGSTVPSLSTFNDHSARHENGGADEISIAGLDGTPTELTNHLNDATDAHDASAISSVAAGNLSSTDVQAALNELDTEKTTAAAALSAAQTEIADQKRVVEILVSDPGGSAITTGDGKACFRVPTLLNGHNLVSVGASVSTVSSSGIPTVQLRRMRLTNATTQSAADMLTTKLTIDASEFDSKDATNAAVIDTSNDDVATGDQINVDIDVAGTGAKGLVVTMTFEAP